MFTGSVVGFITAQQLYRRFRRGTKSFFLKKKGGKGKLRGGRKGGGEAVGPALLALGPALASNCNSSSGEKVSSAWLPLTSPEGLSPPALSPAAGLPFNTHTVPLSFNALPPSSFKTPVLKKREKLLATFSRDDVRLVCLSPLLKSSSSVASSPPNGALVRPSRGVNM